MAPMLEGVGGAGRNVREGVGGGEEGGEGRRAGPAGAGLGWAGLEWAELTRA